MIDFFTGRYMYLPPTLAKFATLFLPQAVYGNQIRNILVCVLVLACPVQKIFKTSVVLVLVVRQKRCNLHMP